MTDKTFWSVFFFKLVYICILYLKTKIRLQSITYFLDAKLSFLNTLYYMTLCLAKTYGHLCSLSSCHFSWPIWGAQRDKRILIIFYLNSYFKRHVCLPIHVSISICVWTCGGKFTPVSAVVSQHFTNKSFLVCVDSGKYAFWVTLRPLPGVNEARWRQNPYIMILGKVKPNSHFIVSSPPLSQLCE